MEQYRAVQNNTALAAKEPRNTGLKTGHYMREDAGLPDPSRQDPPTHRGKARRYNGKNNSRSQGQWSACLFTFRICLHGGLARWLQRVSSFRRMGEFETRN